MTLFGCVYLAVHIQTHWKPIPLREMITLYIVELFGGAGGGENYQPPHNAKEGCTSDLTFEGLTRIIIKRSAN